MQYTTLLFIVQSHLAYILQTIQNYTDSVPLYITEACATMMQTNQTLAPNVYVNVSSSILSSLLQYHHYNPVYDTKQGNINRALFKINK